MTTRRALPQRRFCETFKLRRMQANRAYHITVGYYDGDDRAPGEVFIAGAKAGQEIEAILRDAAVLISLCLQHGVPLETVQHALTKDDDGKHSSVIGAIMGALR